MEFIPQIRQENLKKIRTVDERLVSYNIEMAEVTGGTFWRAYTAKQIEGTEGFPGLESLKEMTAMQEVMQTYPPIDLYDTKLRRLAKRLGPAWIRVSGTWATKTYYDLDGRMNGKVPDGYQNVLTRKQWIGVLDFVKSVDGKLLISLSNCAGDHPDGGPLSLQQAEKIFHFSAQYGVPIDAVEFMNEPNLPEMSGAPAGYTASDYSRDSDILFRWVRENYPKCLLVGPCSTGDPTLIRQGENPMRYGLSGIASGIPGVLTTDALMHDMEVPLDVFSYHCYNGISERIAPLLSNGHWGGSQAFTDEYLSVAANCASAYAALRDQFVPGAPMWVTESGDAGGGGCTWASTYLDVLRTLNELGSFATITDGVIFHNTLASSDYGFLDRNTFEPRPNYYAALIWNRLMGPDVYDCSELNGKEMHIYCQSRKDGKNGAVYLVINNSPKKAIQIKLSCHAVCYTLSADELRSSVMKLNGMELKENGCEWISDELSYIGQNDGTMLLPPASCTFLVV